MHCSRELQTGFGQDPPLSSQDSSLWAVQADHEADPSKMDIKGKKVLFFNQQKIKNGNN